MTDDQQTTTSSITPRPDGSLLVQGPIRVIGTSGEEMETKERFSLCRCGASANKPFCDASHRRIDFSSARESVKPIDRYRAYEGTEVTIEDNRTICAHEAHCIHDLPSVFRKEGRPWIDPKGAEVEEIVRLTHACPSGALRARVNSEPVPEPAREPTIRVMPDGPYLIEGAVELDVEEELSPPVPVRYALCRCGASKNKPYCDGSHYELEKGWGNSPE